MPIYEYYCRECRKRVNVFFRTMSAARDEDARCPLCGGAQLRRLVSRVTVVRSQESRMANLADDGITAGLEGEDPRAMATMMRRMSTELGEPLDGEMAEVIGRLEAGESPEAIDAAMPGLGEGADSGIDPAD